MYRIVSFLLLCFTRSVLGVKSSVHVTVPLASPSGAAYLSPSLVSLSIEQDRWVDWAGTSAANSFFYNTLDNLRQLTGEPPWIRIGADSEDHTNFNPNIQYSDTIFPTYTQIVPYPEASNITVGNGFYQIVEHLPAGTHVIWGLNLRDDNITIAYLETKAIIKAFDSPAVKAAGITLDFLEIGNEADLYVHNGGRKKNTWGPTQYVQNWTAFATNVSATAGLCSDSKTKFIGAAFAESSHNVTGLSPQSIFNAGILNSKVGALITTISQHHYSGSFCSGNGGLLQDLMTKSTIRSNLSSFSPDISATFQRGLSYILGETNSYSCHGAPGVSNAAGAALWALDYTLYAAQIGISRVHFHDGIGYKYNLIQPLTLTRSILDGSPLASPLAPHVQPPYYAAIIAAEAIGSSGSTEAVELFIDNPRIAGYAFYEYGSLTRAVFINSQAYLTGNTARGSVHINLKFGGRRGLRPLIMSVKRLAIGHADDASGLTWGGQSYETRNGRASGIEFTTESFVSDGVDIEDTEVVLLCFLPVGM